MTRLVSELVAVVGVVAALADDCRVNGRKSPPFEFVRASTELKGGKQNEV